MVSGGALSEKQDYSDFIWIESGTEHYMLGSSSCGIGARGVGRTLRGRPALRLRANGLLSTFSEGAVQILS